jgi:hypothetical protein
MYANVEAHANLLALLTPRAPMPPLGGWAIDAAVLQVVVNLLWERRPELVVECGSGSSSVWLGYFAERLAPCQVVALEHNQRFLQASRGLVRMHELRNVDIRDAPLEPWAGDDQQQFRWYARHAWEDLHEIGLLLVDGPPRTTGALARYPAGPLLFPRCAANGVVVLDDADRPDERAIGDRWSKEWPELTRVGLCRGAVQVLQHESTG